MDSRRIGQECTQRTCDTLTRSFVMVTSPFNGVWMYVISAGILFASASDADLRAKVCRRPYGRNDGDADHTGEGENIWAMF